MIARNIETILVVNDFEFLKNEDSYQIYKGDFCIASMRGNYTKIKKYFKKVARR